MSSLHPEYHLLETIEAYLKNTLSKEERIAFETKMKTDENIFKLYKEYQELFLQLKLKHGTETLQSYLQQKQYQNQSVPHKFKIILKKQSLQLQYFVFRNKTALVAASFICIFSALAFYILYLVSNHSNQLIELKRNVASSIHKLEKKIDTKGDVVNAGKIDNVGTGFLIDNDGYVLTNSHILNGAKEIYAENLSGESFKIKLIHTDPSIDLAILKIIDSGFYQKEKVPYAITSRGVELGENIFTLGYPKEDIVYGEGYLSSLTGYNSDSTALQINISLNPGNSGGPIFDTYGNVIGIVRNKQKEADGVSFAIKSDAIMKAIKQFKFNDVTKEFKDFQLNTNTSHTPQNRISRIKKYQNFIYVVKCYS